VAAELLGHIDDVGVLNGNFRILRHEILDER